MKLSLKHQISEEMQFDAGRQSTLKTLIKDKETSYLCGSNIESATET